MQENTAEITLDEFLNLNKNECQIVDIRSSISFDYGKIDGAVNIDYNEFDETKLDKSKKNHTLLQIRNNKPSARRNALRKGFLRLQLKRRLYRLAPKKNRAR